MLDVYLALTDAGADRELEAGDLRGDPTLRTAALVALGTDARAPAEIVAGRPELAEDPRGWWADGDLEPWGGLLWTLYRDKATEGTRVRAAQYVREAFGWFVEEGLAAEVEVAAAVDSGPGSAGRLGFDVRLARGSSRSWSSAWEAMAAEPLTVGPVAVTLSFS